MDSYSHQISVNDRVRYSSAGRPRAGLATAIRHDKQSGQTQVAVESFDGGPRVWLAIERLSSLSAA